MNSLDAMSIFVSALISALVSFLVAIGSIRFTSWRSYQELHLKPDKRFGTLGVVRVVNGYVTPLRNVYAYITMDHQLEDVHSRPPRGYAAFIREPNIKVVEEDRLCWSIAYPEENPPVIDILPGEHQALSVVKINVDEDWIEIPSERGFSSLDDDPLPEPLEPGIGKRRRISRVFLRAQKYNATIKIVSLDTKAKSFKVEIDPYGRDSLIRVL